MLLLSVAVTGEELIDRPENMDEPTKEEKGILSTLVLIYTKTRDAVKFAYDEVMYFKEMRRNFENMQKWFDRARERTEYVWDKSSELFTDPQDVFVTLQRLENIFDHIDYAVWVVPHELDRILARTELTYDNIVTGGQSSAGMVPNTDEVLEYIDTKFGFNHLPSEKDEENGKHVQKLARLKERGHRFPEEELVTASRLVLASSMANSEMYRQWAIKTSSKTPEKDANFATVKGANGQELAACWYAVEQTNANSRLLMNHLEELKVLQATVGLYLFDFSDTRTKELEFKNSLSDVSMYMDIALEK